MPFRMKPRRDRKLNRLVKEADEERLGRGEVLYRAGEPARHVYLVREGHLRLTLPGGERERTVSVVGPSELAGEEALLSGSVRRYGAVAGEIAVVRALDGARVFKALRSTTRTYQALLRAGQEDLHRARLRAAGGGPPTRERLADLIRELAARFGEERGRRLHIPHWFTHQELADLVGGHRSTVTTALNDWIYEGILKGGSELVVLKRKKLEQAGSDLPPAVDPGSG